MLTKRGRSIRWPAPVECRPPGTGGATGKSLDKLLIGHNRHNRTRSQLDEHSQIYRIVCNRITPLRPVL
jgi:hypothetical protein